MNRVQNTKRVASSAVEHSAFNRLVLGSNPRRPIKTYWYRKIDLSSPVYGLALHTSSPQLGLALSNFSDDSRQQTWDLDRDLSNLFHPYLKQFLAPQKWADLAFLATANGTATAGTDYTAIPPTTLTFNPGETSKTITVPVRDFQRIKYPTKK